MEHEGAVYVLLQQASRGRVDLYLLDEEQTVLTYHRTLLNEALFSPTLFQHEGRWWLFGTKKPLADTSLHAYYAQDPEGPFSPHPLNPVKVDIRSARPGGTPFHVGNQLWRPARDSSVEHHGRIALNRVTALSPTHFSEETVKFVDPLMGSWSHAMRTISAVGDITLVDGMRDLIEQASRRSMIGNKDQRKPRKRH